MLDDEKIIQKIALWNDGHDNHGKACREIKQTVSSVSIEIKQYIDMTNSHFTGASIRLRM